MTQIIPFLSFNGNCREAMEFYRDCLDAELNIESMGDSALGNEFPESIRDFVFQAILKKNNLRIIGSDCAPDEGIYPGNSVSLYLNITNQSEVDLIFHRLSSGGQVIYPLRSTYWNEKFGGIKDKFGNHWLISCNT